MKILVATLLVLFSFSLFFGCTDYSISQTGSGIPTVVEKTESSGSVQQDGYLGIDVGTTTETKTEYTPTSVVAMPELKAEITQCNPSINVLQGLGEVTDVFVSVGNAGNADATNVYVEAHANDEDQPFKNSQTLGVLKPGMVADAKLTLDTQKGVTSLVTVVVTSSEGARVEIQRNC